MKKWLCLLLTGTLIFSLSACHRDQTPITSSDDTEDSKIKSAEMYTDFLKNYSSNTELFYFIKDIDNNSIEELIISQNTGIEVYTCGDSVKKVGTHDFITGTVQLYHTNDKMYPGIVFVTIGGGKEHFGYITITDGALTLKQIFDNDFSMISGEKEDVIYTDDEKLIALSKKAYQEDCYITYSKH